MINDKHVIVGTIISLVIMTACLIMPVSAYAADATDSVEMIGHRGYSGMFPENTMPAFEGAYEAGFSGIRQDDCGRKLVKYCHKRGIQIGTYYTLTYEDYEYLSSIGADFAMSDWYLPDQDN